MEKTVLDIETKCSTFRKRLNSFHKMEACICQVRRTSQEIAYFLTLKEVLYSSKSKPRTTVNKQKITYFVGLPSAIRRIQ